MRSLPSKIMIKVLGRFELEAAGNKWSKDKWFENFQESVLKAVTASSQSSGVGPQ